MAKKLEYLTKGGVKCVHCGKKFKTFKGGRNHTCKSSK